MTLEVVSPTEALLDGRYLLEDRVGKGGMATVYRAQDTHLGRTVAIKMIHPGDGEIASADRAHTEKALLASLSHPSLVTLFDAQLEPNRPQYLVMEFVDGPTLAACMASGPIPARQLAHIMRALAEGLAATHAAGIVHRDVKPSNVLLARRSTRSGGQWDAKLADFGIATLIDGAGMTSPGIVLGTLTYMAPEQLTDADPGTPVDVFALGLIVLEALTGEPAYPTLGSGRAAAIARVGTAPTIPDFVEVDWRELLERMTRLDPAARPTAAEVARAARRLARSEDGGGTDAVVAAVTEPVDPAVSAEAALAEPTTPTAVMTASAPRRTRRRLVIGAAGLAVAGFVAVGAAALVPPAAELGRTVSTTAVRLPAEPVAEEPVAEQPVTEEAVTDAAVDAPAAPTDPVADPGNNGNQGNGNGNQGKSDKAKDKEK